MSYRLVQRLIPIRHEWQASRTAVGYLQRCWPRLEGGQESRSTRLSHLHAAADNLEVTYLLRLFAEFEGLLHQVLASRQPRRRVPRTTEALINRVASSERVPDPIRDAVHWVREYRNAVVHPAGPRVPRIGFEQALAALNRFLARLPDPP